MKAYSREELQGMKGMYDEQIRIQFVDQVCATIRQDVLQSAQKGLGSLSTICVGVMVELFQKKVDVIFSTSWVTCFQDVVSQVKQFSARLMAIQVIKKMS